MISFMVLAFILMKIYRRYRLQHYEIPARDVRKGHRWYMVDMFHEQTYCSISPHHAHFTSEICGNIPQSSPQTKHLLYNGKLPCIQW
jgi:uncharacterized membrane protein